MIARSSERARRVLRRYRRKSPLTIRVAARAAAAPVRNERGATVLVLVVGMMVTIGTMAIALEAGRMYLYRARFSRAADAGALAAVRTIREGQPSAAAHAISVAAANGLVEGENGVAVDVEFGTAETGEKTVTVTTSMPIPFIFATLFGRESIRLRSTATAAITPLDIVLVLDQSGSLALGGAWDDLQSAVAEFTEQFAEDHDRVGLVSYHLRAVHRLQLGQPFAAAIPNLLASMDSEGGTNTGDGLMYALQQMQGPAARDRAAKVVVLFTDGQPTVYRGTFNGQTRLLSANQFLTNKGRLYTDFVSGYWSNPESLPVNHIPNPAGCLGSSTCFGMTPRQIVDAANERGRVIADQIRDQGIYVYVIALDDPITYSVGGTKYDLIADMPYVRQLANENGISDPTQPQGVAYHAPRPGDLEQVFRQVARDIKMRLAI